MRTTNAPITFCGERRGVAGELGLHLTTLLTQTGGDNCPYAGARHRTHCQLSSVPLQSPSWYAGTSHPPGILLRSVSFRPSVFISAGPLAPGSSVCSLLSACIYCITIKETLMQTKYIKKTKLLSITCSTKCHLWRWAFCSCVFRGFSFFTLLLNCSRVFLLCIWYPNTFLHA